jgi:hypothetical protein
LITTRVTAPVFLTLLAVSLAGCKPENKLVAPLRGW